MASPLFLSKTKYYRYASGQSVVSIPRQAQVELGLKHKDKLYLLKRGVRGKDCFVAFPKLEGSKPLSEIIVRYYVYKGGASTIGFPVAYADSLGLRHKDEVIISVEYVDGTLALSICPI